MFETIRQMGKRAHLERFIQRAARPACGKVGSSPRKKTLAYAIPRLIAPIEKGKCPEWHEQCAPERANHFALLNPINHVAMRASLHKYKVESFVIAADVDATPPHTGRGG
jgi:hypothetical protein